MGTPGASISPKPRSWWSRRWKRLLLAILAVLAAAGAGGWYAAGGKYKWTEPYRLALQQVQQDPQVRKRLGEPVRDASWLPSGSMTAQGNRETSLMFRVAGPLGTADVQLRARRVGGQWGGTIAVMLGARDRINLDLGEGDEAPKFNAQEGGDAPKFDPGGERPKDVPAGEGPKPNTALPGGPDIRVEIPK